MFGLYFLKCGSKDIKVKFESEYICNCDYEDNYVIVCRNCNNEIDFDQILDQYNK